MGRYKARRVLNMWVNTPAGRMDKCIVGMLYRSLYDDGDGLIGQKLKDELFNKYSHLRPGHRPALADGRVAAAGAGESAARRLPEIRRLTGVQGGEPLRRRVNVKRRASGRPGPLAPAGANFVWAPDPCRPRAGGKDAADAQIAAESSSRRRNLRN